MALGVSSSSTKTSGASGGYIGPVNVGGAATSSSWLTIGSLVLLAALAFFAIWKKK